MPKASFGNRVFRVASQEQRALHRKALRSMLQSKPRPPDLVGDLVPNRIQGNPLSPPFTSVLGVRIQGGRPLQ